MNKPSSLRAPWWCMTAAAVCMAGMWLYAQRVLVGHQVADAAVHSRPRGNLSDLYPRWLGARELLLHGRDPYSAEVTRDIQVGFYGRPIDSSRPDDPRDQEGFAYPVYVVFYLAPTVHLPFETVRQGFFWLLASLTVASVLIWLRVLHWDLAPSALASVLGFTFGAFAVLQGLKLQQMTMLVAAFLALAIFLLQKEHLISAGFLLALATIKPQVVVGLLFWLAIWAVGDWRRRCRLALSFLITMAVLFGAAEVVLPHWIPRFVQAVRAYRIYASPVAIFDIFLPSPWGTLAKFGTGLGTFLIAWRNRRTAADTDTFALTTCLILAATLLIVPTSALYNQVLLLPALLLLARDRHAIWGRGRVPRVLTVAVVLLLSWQWVSSTVLAALSFVLPAGTVQQAWTLPAWTALTFPVAVVPLVLLVAYWGSSDATPGRVPA